MHLLTLSHRHRTKSCMKIEKRMIAQCVPEHHVTENVQSIHARFLTQIQFPSQKVNTVSGIRAHGQEADHRYSCGGFMPHLLQVEDYSLGILHSH